MNTFRILVTLAEKTEKIATQKSEFKSVLQHYKSRLHQSNLSSENMGRTNISN